MIKIKSTQLYLALSFAAGLLIAIALYLAWVVTNFNSNEVLLNSRFLSGYSQRAISRYEVNPALFTARDSTNKYPRYRVTHVNLVLSYQSLEKIFPQIPPEAAFHLHEFKVIIIDDRGFLKTPNFVLILPALLKSGQRVYSYLYVDETLNNKTLDIWMLEKIQPAIYTTIISILMLAIVQIFHIRRINNNIANFANWTNQLSTGKSPPIPEFSSSKYSYMAFTIDRSLSSISQMLHKEQSFAKFTSHELRTPVAVLSANLEVLELMMQDLSPQERNVLKNMESAVSDMKYQMEALLWLSREDEKDLESVPCDIKALIDKAILDNAYLIKKKEITTEFVGSGGVVTSNLIFLQIILNNLIRNAYQNTEQGIVRITLSDNGIAIENINQAKNIPTKKNAGFGIGLALVDKLISKLKIEYHVDIKASGRAIKLTFNENDRPK